MTSNWKKKIPRPPVLFRHTRPRSSPALSSLASTPASEAVRLYDEEADRCLRDLEFEADLLNYGRIRKSPCPPVEDIMRASTTTTTTTSTQYVSSPDLLGTFCHLMHYVVHLRRENRHLRKQVLCLHEMRQIERLQNELLRSACTCDTVVSAAAVLVDTNDKKPANEDWKTQDKRHWRHSTPLNVHASVEMSSMKSNSTSTSLATITKNSKSASRSLVTPAVTMRKDVSAGASRIQVLSGQKGPAGGEISDRLSLRDAAGDQMPSAPGTTSAQGRTAGAFGAAVTKSGQQMASSKSRFLAPPALTATVANLAKQKIRLLSASSSGGSAEGVAQTENHPDCVGHRAASPSHSPTSGANLLTRSLLSPSSWCGRRFANGNERGIRHGAEEALAEATDDRAFLLMHSSLDSTSYSPRSMSSAGSSLTKSFNAQMPSNDSRDAFLGRYGTSGASVTDSDDVTAKTAVFFLPQYSDSDADHSVFTEVQLPDYRRPDTDRALGSSAETAAGFARKSGGSPRVWRVNDLNRMSSVSGSGAAVLSLPDHDGPVGATASAQKGSPGLLSRLGLKRPSVLTKRRVRLPSMGEERAQEKPTFITPLVSKSMYDDKSGNQKQQPRPQSLIDFPSDRWKMARKAFLKKRKRKISESDSLASSNASGKSYMTIELPDISYCRKISYPPSVPIITTVDVDSLSKSVSKDYANKMRQWQQDRQGVIQQQNQKRLASIAKKESDEGGGIMRKMSQKGQQIKRGWLRKPKCTNGDSTIDEPSSGLYFEEDDGRQDTVVENDATMKLDSADHGTRKALVAWSVSDTDISRKSGLDEVGPNAGGPIEMSKHQRQQQQSKDHFSQEQQKQRSVTFLEQLSPTDCETTVSMTTSQQLTISNDSVFTSPDSDAHCCRSSGVCSTTAMTTRISANRQLRQQLRLEQQQQQQASDVVEQLLILQERNSLLIRTLKDKTKEYERITERLCDLEKEVQTLRERHRFDTNLEQLYNAVLEPNFVPTSFVQEMEKHVEQLDHTVRVVKSEAYETQQMALETHANDQATTTRYLNQIDSLQKANFHLLSKALSELNRDEYPEIRRQLELLPTYEALYSFTINLLRKLKHIRTKLLERNFSVSKLDLELLQTQSSLLLAHAQIERQKMEMRLLKSKYDVSNPGDFTSDHKAATTQSVRRTHSYHGQDILARAVNSELSFYLPFKLHGFHTMKRDRESNVPTYTGDEALELEFAKLFDTVNRLSSHYDEIQLPLQSTNDEHSKREASKRNIQQQPRANQGEKSCQPQSSNISAVELRMRWRQNGSQRTTEGEPVPKTHQQQPRPTSCNMLVKETEVKRIAEEIAAGRYFMSNSAGAQAVKPLPKAPPNYLKKAPPPLKLGNVGQVKAIAAAFDGGADDVTSAPNTPLAKAAPHLLQRRNAGLKELRPARATESGPASRRQGMKPASHRRDFDRSAEEDKAGSRIPIRATVGQKQTLSIAKSDLQQKSESPYETLTFLCRESNLASPPTSVSQLSPSTSCSVGIMEKSTSPDVDTASSIASTASSCWSISKRNEAKKLQFFYGSPQKQQPRLLCPELPTSPVPPSSPTPKTPSTPIPPTPTPPSSNTRFPEFARLHNPSDNGLGLNLAKANQKTKERVRGDPGSVMTSSIPVPAEKNSTKKQSWFQKLRHKN